MSFKKITDLRKAKNMSLEDLAVASNLPIGTIKKISAGINTNPTLDTMKAIARALNCSLDAFDDTCPSVITPIDNELLDTFDQLPESLQNDVLTYAKVTLAKHQMEHEQSLTAALAAFGGSSGKIRYTDEEMQKIKEVISSLKHTD